MTLAPAIPKLSNKIEQKDLLDKKLNKLVKINSLKKKARLLIIFVALNIYISTIAFQQLAAAIF